MTHRSPVPCNPYRSETVAGRVWGLALAGLVAASAGVAGCGPDAPTDVVIARIQLTSDRSGALQQSLCLHTRPAEQCAPYPNPLECDRLDVEVLADGRTFGHCQRSGEPDLPPDAVDAALPLVCGLAESGCIECRDTHGEVIVDACGGRQIVVVPQVTLVSETVQTIARRVPTDGLSVSPPTATPPGEGQASCAERTRRVFSDTMNALLQSEGLPFSFQASGVEPTFVPRDPDYAAKKCKSIAIHGLLTQCDPNAQRQDQTGCYCFGGEASGGPPTTCRCDRMVNRVLDAACEDIPEGCEKRWSAYWVHFKGEMHRWLWQTVGYDPYASDSPAPLGSPPPAGRIVCFGSPLVVDRRGDGVATTALSRGVRFDLFGEGAMRTGWLQDGDDAFVAWDRNGNGRIDGGGELFGEASGGPVGIDGFAALAQLDQAEHGGNGDGWISDADQHFGELLLWHDENGDARSQSDELTPLVASEITALGVRPLRRQTTLDEHGNDLGTRGLFRRNDGRFGPLVDVYFRSAR